MCQIEYKQIKTNIGHYGKTINYNVYIYNIISRV